MNTSDPNDRAGGTDGRAHVHAPYYEDASARTAASATAPSSSSTADASVGTLLKELAHEVPALLRNELALARSEMREHMSEVQKATGSIATGGAVALAGLVIVLMAAVYLLSEVMAPWLAALIVGGIALAAGYMLVTAGREKLKNASLRPDRTVDSLRKDTNAIRGGTQ
ncbi:phage holin family protein [Lysobacter humi (ex Lee et al. 2017)]